MLKTRYFAYVAAFVLAASAAPSQAETMLNIIIGNFDIAFDGQSGEITDFNSPAGGTLDPNDARTVSSFEVEVDGASQALLMSPPDNLYADLKLVDLGPDLAIGTLEQNVGGSGDPTAFGFDFFTDAGGGTQLRLGIDDISYSLITTPIPSLNFFNIFAEAKVLAQTLPNGVLLNEDVLVSYTATEVMVLPGPGGARSVIASGAMTITGIVIPEPTTASLVALSSVVAGFRRRR